MMKRALILAILLFPFLSASPATPAAPAAAPPSCPAAAPWPPAARLEFNAHASWGVLGLSGTNVMTLKRDGDAYSLVSETSAGALFSARQSSRGRVSTKGIVPLEYVERNLNRPAMTTRFDWTKHTVHFTETEDTVPTEPQMQDRASATLQVGWMLRNGLPVIDTPVAGVRGASIYHFVERGREAIDTTAGRFDTIKVERPMTEEDDRIEVWLAPSLCYLPVRSKFTERKGAVIANELRSARFD
jgi:hypothetical protein